MKLGTWIMLAGIALMNMNCAHGEGQVDVDDQVNVDGHVHEQSYAVEAELAADAELEGGCSAAMQVACMQYCGGYCTNNGQSCRCPRGTY